MTILYTGKRQIHNSNGRTDMKRGLCTVLRKDGTPLPSLFISEERYPGRVFEWGYSGVLPANLARSILVDFLNKDSDDEFFNAVVNRFCREVVVNLDYMDWEIEESQLKNYLTRIITEIYGDELYENDL